MTEEQYLATTIVITQEKNDLVYSSIHIYQNEAYLVILFQYYLYREVKGIANRVIVSEILLFLGHCPFNEYIPKYYSFFKLIFVNQPECKTQFNVHHKKYFQFSQIINFNLTIKCYVLIKPFWSEPLWLVKISS